MKPAYASVMKGGKEVYNSYGGTINTHGHFTSGQLAAAQKSTVIKIHGYHLFLPLTLPVLFRWFTVYTTCLKLGIIIATESQMYFHKEART